MNEVSNKYDDLDPEDLKAFKVTYRTCQTNLLRASTYAYKLKKQNEVQFLDYCQNELQISKATLSKMLSAGKLMIEKPASIMLPKAYSTVYELTKIDERLPEFSQYCTQNGVEINDLSNRQAHHLVKKFCEENNPEPLESKKKDSNKKEEDPDQEARNTLENVLTLLEEIRTLKDKKSIISRCDFLIEILKKEVNK